MPTGLLAWPFTRTPTVRRPYPKPDFAPGRANPPGEPKTGTGSCRLQFRTNEPRMNTNGHRLGVLEGRPPCRPGCWHGHLHGHRRCGVPTQSRTLPQVGRTLRVSRRPTRGRADSIMTDEPRMNTNGHRLGVLEGRPPCRPGGLKGSPFFHHSSSPSWPFSGPWTLDLGPWVFCGQAWRS